MKETDPNWEGAPKDGSVIKVQFMSDKETREARWNGTEWTVRSEGGQWIRMEFDSAGPEVPVVWYPT